MHFHSIGGVASTSVSLKHQPGAANQVSGVFIDGFKKPAENQ
jgi:hypothetical protein